MAPEQITALVAIGESEMLEFKQSMGTRRAPTTTLTSPGRNGTILILKGTRSGVQLFSYAPQPLPGRAAIQKVKRSPPVHKSPWLARLRREDRLIGSAAAEAALARLRAGAPGVAVATDRAGEGELLRRVRDSTPTASGGCIGGRWGKPGATSRSSCRLPWKRTGRSSSTPTRDMTAIRGCAPGERRIEASGTLCRREASQPRWWPSPGRSER